MSQNDLTPKDIQALKDIVSDWIGDGFTTPPYTNEQYNIFEWLGISNDDFTASYDIRRPPNP